MSVAIMLAIGFAGRRSNTALADLLRYLRRNPELVVGLCLLGSLLTFVVVGHLVVNLDRAKPFSDRPLLPPSQASPLGTDKQGRDLLAILILGTPQTLEIGFLAGALGVSLGTLLAMVSAFYRGVADTLIGIVIDTGLTIPGLLVLVTLAKTIHAKLSIPELALVIAALAWLHPARVIRAQLLSVREQTYIAVAYLNGMPQRDIVVKEVLPNLLPYIVASLVGAISAGVLASVGLEVFGFGSLDSVTIGMTLYWVIYYAAIINSWWWWWLPPIIVIFILFVGLFLVSIGLDEFANPRLPRRL